MNIENAKKLVGQLERLPDEKFWMPNWIVHPEKFYLYDVERPQECGTVACIAGWAYLANANEEKMRPDVWASDWLDLETAEADSLFSGEWSQKHIRKITRADAIGELRRMIAEAEHAAS